MKSNRILLDYNIDFNVNFIMDFICTFNGFDMKSTWFHMKDWEKVGELTSISCFYWFHVDFIWNPLDLIMNFMKSNTMCNRISWNSEISKNFMKFNGILLDYNADFTVDFICTFNGFDMISTWFQMKDREKVRDLTWISGFHWFHVSSIYNHHLGLKIEHFLV